MIPQRWAWWRRAHQIASGLVLVVALLHILVTPVLYK